MTKAFQPGLGGFTRAAFLQGSWSFGPVSGPPYQYYLKLLPDERIGNYFHPNETYWRVTDEGLVFFNQADEATTIFDQYRL
ncbi:MAG TPA: hypothetical protein PLT25_11450, partial [Acidocella sp.]